MPSSFKRWFLQDGRSSTLLEFVNFWSDRYDVHYDRNYAKNINGPHTKDTLSALIEWKNGGRLSDRKSNSFRKHFLEEIARAKQLAASNICGRAFLETEFPLGGRVWRIFWLHCWSPRSFPIYDQHVHRAMTYFQDGVCDELGNYSDSEVINFYLDRYIPFFQAFAQQKVSFDADSEGIQERKADRALHTFGRSIKIAGS